MLTELFIPKYSLNIDRASMPQVRSTDMSDYLRWLKLHKHISSIHTELQVNTLTPSQGNFNQSKIHDFMTHKRVELRKPIVVSADHYVVDGHHRWIALLNMDPHDTIPVILMSAKILDLLAATKEYPKSFTKNVVESFASITEAAEKHAVLAFGRMNPPTSGHAKLVDKVHEVAKEHNAHHEVVLSHTQDAKNNPLSQTDKIKHAKRAFPTGTNIKAASKAAPSIFHHAAELHKSGFKHLHVVVGSDRVKEFHDSIHKYNGKFDKEGHGYQFKSITVHSAGARDPNAKGVEGMSASKMREHAASGNFKSFKQGVSSTVSHAHAKELYNDVRKGQGHLHETVGQVPCECTSLKRPGGLKEEVEHLTEGVHDAGIFKAIFLAGAPGSGKDFVLKKSLLGHGLTEIDSDTALEHLMDKHKLDKKMPEHEQEKRGEIRDRAKSLTELRQRLALHGRNGLIISSTGAKKEQIKKIKDMVEELGYNTKMVFVDASDNVSRNRNIERGQRGGRMIPEKLRAEKWRAAQDARVHFAKMFGGEHYHEFNNDEDLRHNTDPEIHTQKTKELDDIFKTVKKFTQQPPEHPAAQEWVHKNLGKLAKQPVGNKKQQSSQIPASSDSQATEEARKLGLQYYGYGRYGKSGRITHFSLNGKLVEKKKALTPPKSLQANTAQPQAPKKLNEAFEDLLLEDNDHGTLSDIRSSDSVDNLVLVAGPEVLARRLQHVLAEGGSGPLGGEVGPDGLYELGSSIHGRTEEETQIQEKVSFGAFRNRLVIPRAQEKETLKEGEPTQDLGGDGGPILGTGSAEVIDPTNGGVATSGPKKTLKQLKTGIK